MLPIQLYLFDFPKDFCSKTDIYCMCFIYYLVWNRFQKTETLFGQITLKNYASQDSIIRNLLTIYHKYCNLIGYRTHYLSGDR